MIVAHLSDLHLGFRAYDRIERGVDLRERDVSAAFDRAVQALVKIGPDVVIVAGDVFERPDPPASAVVTLARGLEGLRTALPDVPVLMVAGPRDTPRRPGDPGALAVLDTFPNVEAATSLTRSILIRRLSLNACLVPYRAVVRHPPAQPETDPRMDWNIMVLHGATATGGSGIHVDEEWDYVALGGEHRRRTVGPRIRYSGSLERVALDPWDEAADEKGFLTVDLASGESTFHSIPGRPVVALAPIRVSPGDPVRLQRRVREVMGEVPGGIDGKIVRLRLDGATPHDLLALQGEPLADLRQRALHLAIEAGKEPATPPDSWLTADWARSLGTALENELERDGRLDDVTRAEIGALIVRDGTPSLRAPIGAMEALDGTLDGIGRVSTSIPVGLTGIIGGGGRSRRAVAQLLVEQGGGVTDPLTRLWAGDDSETLDDVVRMAVAAIGATRGLTYLDDALAEVGTRTRSGSEDDQTATDSDRAPADVSAPGVTTGAGIEAPSGAGTGAARMDPKQVAAEFRSAERDLRTLRADVVEVDGDLEVATMDWLRERQDAETTLNAYRDRARELRTRMRAMESAGPDAPCPTCGRVLEEHYREVLDELKDQWEGVVQDGSWWRSRWEQLELKPVRLQELEKQSLRLHAALESGGERVELLRARMADVDRRVSDGRGSERGGVPGAVVDALRRVRHARVARVTDLLLDRASRFLCRISGGRILAITRHEGIASLQGDRGPLAPVSEEDLAAARVAVRLAAAALVAARGRVLASLVVEEPFDRLDSEARTRALILMRRLLTEIPRIVLFSRGEAVDARPELFDSVLEVRDDVSNVGALLRPAPAGTGRVVIAAPTPPGRPSPVT